MAIVAYNAGMKFTKMHGLGNDYVYVNGFDEAVADAASLAIRMADRHTGIGSDGLIIIGPADNADVSMKMYNADGSRAQMCGNGIRCVAKFAVEHGLVSGPELAIATDGGVKNVQCELDGDAVTRVRVNMGRPSFAPRDLPSTLEGPRIVDHVLRIGDDQLPITCVSMGNPHAVAFVKGLNSLDVARLGPLLENAAEFPQRINAHFAQVDSVTHITMRSWERGSGETRACGTGACAVCVAAAITDQSERRVTVSLPGGDLSIDWSHDDQVYMTGPAVEVFSGEWRDVS